MQINTLSPRDLMLIVVVTLIWGLNFSVIKAGVSNVDPLVLTGLRFSFAALPAIFFIRKPELHWIYLATYGIICGVGIWGMMSLSLYYGLSAGTASLILEFSVFITVMLGVVTLKEQINDGQKIGLCLSFIGLLFIANISDGSVTMIGFIFALLGAIGFSFLNLLVKKIAIKDMFAFVAWSSLFAPIPLFLMAYVINDVDIYSEITALNQVALASVLFQAYPTTLLGYWLWNKIIVKYPLSMMVPFKLLVPLFALLGSVMFYNEQLEINKIIAFLLIIAGVALPVLIPFIKQLPITKVIYKSNRQ